MRTGERVAESVERTREGSGTRNAHRVRVQDLEEVGVELVQSLARANQVDRPPLQTLAEPCPGGGHPDWRCKGPRCGTLERRRETDLETVILAKTRWRQMESVVQEGVDMTQGVSVQGRIAVLEEIKPVTKENENEDKTKSLHSSGFQAKLALT
jgi:hypothetical protein